MTGRTAAAGGVPRVLHILGSLAADDPQAQRCVRLVNAFGGRLRHALHAADGDHGALAAVAKGVTAESREQFPKLRGLPLPGRLQAIARAMTDHHLVLTYGRAGAGAALAHTAFSQVHALPPLIHHEDGSDETARQRAGLSSTWLRRVGLGRAAGLVVTNETMEAAALVDWRQPLGRVKRIGDGVALARFASPARPDAIPRLLKREGERWIGCFARHRGGERLAPLVETLARLAEEWHLVILGEGPGRAEAEAQAARLRLEHRIHFTGPVADRAASIALFDILAVPEGSEPLPLSVIEAMAAGKPVAGLAAAEARASLSADNAEGDNGGLVRLAGDEWLRRQIGAANRERAEAERAEAAMIAAYRRLYASAMRLETI